MFSHLPEPKLDPILSLSVAYKEDSRAEKVDLGIGVYKNSAGETPIMQAVGLAQHKVVATQKTKSYVGLAGCEEFNQSMVSLVLGDTPILDRITAIQTPGASGGLRMLGDLIKAAQSHSTVWLSNPSYVNHQPVMEAAGLKVKHYRYFCPKTKQVDTASMLEDLSKAGKDDVVLLHGCCHNPTGADIDFAAWQQITQLAVEKGFTPFVDFAYQGFGDGIEEDAAGLRYMAERVEEMMFTASCSKNFGLYRERTGVAMVLGKSAIDARNAKGKLLTLARATYTMPPDHGAALVKTILQDSELTQIWRQELNSMQNRLVTLRQALCREFNTQHGTSEFDFIQNHKGMFTVLGLTPQQMAQLRQDFAIYAVGDGRINIAGLTEKDIPYVANAILKVS